MVFIYSFSFLNLSSASFLNSSWYLLNVILNIFKYPP
nr:MAG TPA: hypothetical protein [Caudoviricetes sp.]